ncbi:DUF4349 domain-containing protein [Streptomyces sp. NPDC059009]|uniref:DUF4349 domain-containing protein n=1 Tax=Streptomyces sp. NPDC059009 TaxID=3346694 RepID=UPI00368E9A77
MRTSRHRSARWGAGILLAVALALAGCGGTGGDDDAKSAGRGGRPAAPEGGAADQDQDQDQGTGAADGTGADGGADKSGARQPPKVLGAHVIRTAHLTVRVKDVPKALDEARTAAEGAGGFVGDESTDRDSRGHERSRVVLRVPQDAYKEVLADLQGTGKLLSRTAKAQDVSDQVVDVESRVKSQRASVARVRELMDQATKLSDVVSLEGELSTRQADLEALLAQRDALKDRTTMATITLTLRETSAPADGVEDDDPTFVDALSGGWGAFLAMLRWLAVALGAVLPFAALAALLVVTWRRFAGPRLARRPQPAAGPAGEAADPNAPEAPATSQAPEK